MASQNAAVSSIGNQNGSSIPVDREHSEKWLVEAAQGGYSAAFATLCQRYTNQILRAAYRITRSREDAEDAVQESLLSAFIHIADFDGRSSFGTWLTRIAINSSLVILRKRRASREIPMDSSNEFGEKLPVQEPADPALNPEKEYAENQRRKMLRTAVHRLRPAMRKAIELRQLEEHSLDQTASLMGVSVAAAKSRIFHARRALRKSAILRPMHQRFAARGTRRVAAAA